MKNLYSLLAASSIAFLLSLLLNQWPACYSVHWWIALAVHVIIHGVLHFVYRIRSDHKSYTELLFGTIAVKIFIFLIIIFVYSLLNNKGLFSFAIHFLVHYILFTVLEMRYLFSLIKKRDKISQ